MNLNDCGNSLHERLMRIKKNKNGNEYILTSDNMWVRNFTKDNVPYSDINKTIQAKDHFLFLTNEFKNQLEKYTWIDSNPIYHPNIIIVSDGFNFKEKHKILDNLPKDIVIIGVNGSLKKWQCQRNLSYYVVNNPYDECMSYLPRTNRPLPRCIAATRTNFMFLNKYNGIKYRYSPVEESEYEGSWKKEALWQIDDYRNPVCASIGLSYKFGVEKLLLLCCDSSFKEERPGADKLENNLWMYPQQKIASNLIGSNLFWLSQEKNYEIKVADCSSGIKHEFAAYIDEDKIIDFFEN